MTAIDELRGLLRLRILQLLAFTALMVGVGTLCFTTKYCVSDLDIWWHLKVGDWIVQNHGVPHTGIFSYTAASRPWVAYSWGYEVLLSLAYAWFNLVGIGAFGVLLTLGVAGALFWMLHRLSGRFWVAWILTIAACSAFLFNLMPRPVFFSMMLFAIALTLILEAQRTGRVELLYWLALVFLLWANLHIQFIYGLFVVGLFVGVNLLQRVAGSLGVSPNALLQPQLPAAKCVGVFVACALAGCVGPYSYHLYQVILEYSKAQVPYSMIVELQALSFRSWTHYLQLLLAAGAFFTIGCQKKIDPFKLALLTIAAIVAFRTTRDGWFVCITAVAFIADFPVEGNALVRTPGRVETGAVAVVIVLLLFLIGPNLDFNQRGLDRVVSSQFPVDAVNFLRKNPLPGPLYNSFDWGGFLIWYMPQYPVAIDGRNDLYGDELDLQFYKTEGADPSYANDPFLNNAGLILLRTNVPIAKALRVDPRFRQVYRDELAVVFVRQ